MYTQYLTQISLLLCGLWPLQDLNQPSLLHKSLQLLVDLMLLRYSSTLQHDQQLLQQLGNLPPRLAAAVIARSDEKVVLQQMKEVSTRDKLYKIDPRIY